MKKGVRLLVGLVCLAVLLRLAGGLHDGAALAAASASATSQATATAAGTGRVSPSPVGSATPAPLPMYSRGDLHIHTICSDGENDYETMVQQALLMRYAFIAITDHRFGGSAICKETLRKCRQEKRLVCVPGMEVSGKVHLLALGITTTVSEKLPVKEQVKEIHKQGGLAIAAHPFVSPWRYTDEELFRSGLDAMECRDIPSADVSRFIDMQKKYPLPCVYNSDAHSRLQMTMYTICMGEIKSFADLKKAIKEKRCFQ